MVLLSIQYFPNIQYFTKILEHGQIILEAHENYQRQTYRNRCKIYAANGIQTLSVPIEKNESEKNIRQIRIAYHTQWQMNHWKSIVSAYKNAPYFEHYEHKIKRLFFTKEEFLWNLNQKTIETILDLLSLKVNLQFSSHYEKNAQNDWRNGIHPKPQHCFPDDDFVPEKYYQVFASKHGFIPNLSILDLLFNEGPNSIVILKKSSKKLLTENKLVFSKAEKNKP
ncbi:MAG TPA: WbqC family protein [Salinivirgaceae bacterium]|nr:WbqC family protein [Salinivirgaceae bacterium]